MGPSGAGKSTLCSLFGNFSLVAKVLKGNIIIENFYNPQEN
jgi:ABC-type lipoprotein export system ATPase subunit